MSSHCIVPGCKKHTQTRTLIFIKAFFDVPGGECAPLILAAKSQRL